MNTRQASTSLCGSSHDARQTKRTTNATAAFTVRSTLAFSCEAVWRGPGQTQRLLGPTALSIPWRPALRRCDGQGGSGTGVARQSHLCQGRDRPDRQLQRLVRRPASAINGF